jgi:DNA repair protein RadC
MPIIHSPQEAYEYLSDMKDLRREHLRGLYLNIKGKLIWDEVISIGTLSKALVTPREILAPAIERGASGIIVAHNHLSGVAEPSSEDLEMTIQIENAAELMKLDLWDHIIITQNGYYSFNEAGKIKCAIQAGKFGKGKK